MSYGWFQEVKAEESLQQGDLFINIKIPQLEVMDHSSAAKIQKSIKLKFKEGSFMIITQSCDLEPDNNKDIGSVVLAPVMTVTEFVKENPKYFSREKITSVVTRKKLGLAILNPPDASPLGNELIIVALHHPYLLDYDSLSTLSRDKSYSRRYRLKSPFVEYISSNFSYLFSRVAIPGTFPLEEQINASVEAAKAFNPELQS